MPIKFNFRLLLNIVAVLISLLAVIYWVKLYRHLYKKDEREIRGWRWVFVAVLAILLFNISSVYLFLNISDLYVKINVARIFPNARNQVLYIDMGTMEFYNLVGRTIIGLSMTIGAYLIYSPMRRMKGTQYRFVPVTPATEKRSIEAAKYKLESATLYLVKEERPVKGTKDYIIKGSQPNRSLSIFVDLVTHGVPGLCITRTQPQKIRQNFGLKKIPILWLTRSSDYRGKIEPSDLVELSQTMREFISKTENTVVLLDGIEYLITQNNFEEVLRFVQSLNDTFSMSNSMLIMPIDPLTLDEKQLHLLEKEMSEITSVWKT